MSSGNNVANQAFDDYGSNVLGGGDGVSHATKGLVDRSNNKTSESVSSLLTGKDGEIRLGEYILSMGTDGVGTKVQIYMRQYENYFQEYSKSKKEDSDYCAILNKAVELCDRMLSDLTAMLFDDGIKGERTIAFTDIIDTNSTNNEHGTREEIFFKAFKIALGRSIIDKNALCLNGETANLGENGKLVRALERYAKTWKILENDLAEREDQLFMIELRGDLDLVPLIKGSIKTILDEINSSKEYVQNLLNELELNLAGTFLGIRRASEENKKLVEMEEGDLIIVLSETPTEKGILSPRSNGLTLIRKLMKELLGDNWENKTFEDYLEAIGDKVSMVPEKLKQKLAGLKMWDIATGKTTVFNKFIADDLLGGIDGQPIAKISGLRHGTGNPQFKLYSGLEGREDLMIDMDISELEKADIFTLLQIAFDLDDKTVAKPFNMGIPYTIFCKPGEGDKILEKARKSGITANLVGEIKKRNDGDPSVRIKGVGIGKSEVTYSKN